ncbi:MAG: PAS domain-containing protein, partial [Candidatus Heimdallarchaeota archaeon]|nr:PAS domain-containing protein [Candidatus Heimdallarchaeota archaeon]MCK4254802.1 PAS domain-containing protein [Candidatus Heimdallarchaeota archaeon]
MTVLSEVYKIEGKKLKKDVSEDKAYTNFVHSLIDVNSVSDIIEKMFKLLFELYKLEEGCFYYVDKRENTLTAFRRRSKELEPVVILREKLLSRLYSIKKPQTRKRSISLRKNIPTIYCPFHLDNSLEFMIELPVSNAALNTNQITNDLIKILPIICISLKNADYLRFTEICAKESTKILQSISSGIASVDSKGTFLFVNQMFEMMIGYNLGELSASSTLINNIFPDFSFIILEGNVMDDLIYNIRRKDGTEFPCHITITQVS